MEKIKVTGFSAGFIDKDCIGQVHIVCPTGDREFTLCGYAFVDEQFEISKEKVNCENCIKDLKEYEQLIKEFKKQRSEIE